MRRPQQQPVLLDTTWDHLVGWPPALCASNPRTRWFCFQLFGWVRNRYGCIRLARPPLTARMFHGERCASELTRRGEREIEAANSHSTQSTTIAQRVGGKFRRPGVLGGWIGGLGVATCAIQNTREAKPRTLSVC